MEVATPLASRLLAAGVSLLGVTLLSATQADPDLWGHVRYGLDILETWRLPSIDPYSFTQDVPWVNHEWLSELLMALAWRVGGSPGLTLLKGSLVFLAFILVWQALRGVEPGPRIGLMLVLFLGTARLTGTLRPQVWSLACLAILCRALISPDRRWRRALPLLFIVWVNLHGGWVVGLGVLGVWSAVEWWLSPDRRGGIAGTLVVCAVATLINPYSWRMWDFIGSTVRLGRDITEWQPLWTVSPLVWLPWLAIVGLGVIVSRHADERRWPAMAVLVMLAYASLRVERLTPLFVLSGVVFGAAAVRHAWPSAGRRVGGIRFAAAAASASVALATAAVVARTTLTCLPVAGEWAPDVAIAGRLTAAIRPARLVVFFDWGQYALWHWGPDLKVSMDGRRETVYSDARLAEHAAILDGRPEGLAVLEEWQAEYIWLPEGNGRTAEWLAGNGYVIDERRRTGLLARRRDLPGLPAPTDDSPVRRCFPD